MYNFVDIFSDNKIFAEYLISFYLKNNLQAKVIDYFDSDGSANASRANYSIFIIDKDISNKNTLLEKYFSIALKSYKSLFIFPYINTQNEYQIIKKWEKQLLSDLNIVCGIIFSGEPLLSGTNKFGHVLMPMDINWLSSKIVSLTLSMKGYGKRTALVGSSIGKTVDMPLVVAEYDQVEICPIRIENNSWQDEKQTNNYVRDIESVVFPKFDDFKGNQSNEINIDGSNWSSNGESHLKNKKDQVEVANNKTKNTFNTIRQRFGNINLKKTTLLVAVLISIYFMIPGVLYTISLQTLKITFHKTLLIRPNLSKYIIFGSELSNNLGLKLSEKNTAILLIGKYYYWQVDQSGRLKNIISIAKQFNESNIELLTVLSDFSVGKSADNWHSYNNLATSFDFLQTSLGFLQADEAVQHIPELNKLFSPQNVGSQRTKLAAMRNFANKTPEVLGKDGVSKYLIMVDDSETMLGSRGLINAIAIVEITGAKVNNISFYSPEHIHSQLKGVVEPPSDFEKYFKDNWKFDKVGWHSDFQHTAKSTLWFIENSLNEKLDGVIAINNKALLGLSKFPKTDIKPDSQTYGEFLLKEEFISAYQALFNNENYKNNELMYEVKNLLEEKSIQVYSNSNEIQKSLNVLGWTGEVALPTCGNVCYTDLVGEWEVPKSKGVENIQKEIDLSIAFEEGVIKKRLTIYVKNQNDFDYEAVYKIAAPLDSGFAPIVLVSNENKEIFDGLTLTVNGFKENSILVKVGSYKTLGISFYWEQPFQSNVNYDNYTLKVLKQPGGQNHNYSLSFSLPPNVNIKTPQSYSLTEGGKLVYNTKLSSDIITEIKFLK